MDGFKKSADALGSSMADLGMRLTAAVSIPLAGVSVAALKMANSMEQASMAFKTMMGSSDAAKIHLEDLKSSLLKLRLSLRTWCSRRNGCRRLDLRPIR